MFAQSSFFWEGENMIFILGILFAVLIGIWANHRGRNPIVWGIVSLLLSPLLAAIALALMKKTALIRVFFGTVSVFLKQTSIPVWIT